jgi:hypothetical protein
MIHGTGMIHGTRCAAVPGVAAPCTPVAPGGAQYY